MFTEPVLTFSGNLVRDVTLRTLAGGNAVAHLRIAATSRRFDRDTNSWRDGETCFFSVTCWRTTAQNAAQSLRKGDRVLVVGRVRQRSYTAANNEVREVFDVDADAIGVDLSRSAMRLARVDSLNALPEQATAPDPYAPPRRSEESAAGEFADPVFDRGADPHADPHADFPADPTNEGPDDDAVTAAVRLDDDALEPVG